MFILFGVNFFGISFATSAVLGVGLLLIGMSMPREKRAPDYSKPPKGNVPDVYKGIKPHSSQVDGQSWSAHKYIADRIASAVIPVTPVEGDTGSHARRMIDWLVQVGNYNEPHICAMTDINLVTLTAVRRGANLAQKHYTRLLDFYKKANRDYINTL